MAKLHKRRQFRLKQLLVGRNVTIQITAAKEGQSPCIAVT